MSARNKQNIILCCNSESKKLWGVALDVFEGEKKYIFHDKSKVGLVHKIAGRVLFKFKRHFLFHDKSKVVLVHTYNRR